MKVAVITERAIIQRFAEGVHGTGWGTAGASGIAGAEVNRSSRGSMRIQGSTSYCSPVRRGSIHQSRRASPWAGYFRKGSISGWLGKRAVEVRIGAVDEDDLPRGVAALRRGEQEDGHGGNLSSFRKAMAEGNALPDRLERRFGVGARGDPALVERGHDFSRKDRVGADAERSELGSPFAGERQLGAFGSGVGGGSTLAGERDFGADVDDGAARGFEHGQRIMRHGVVVDEILLQALDEAIRRAGFEA